MKTKTLLVPVVIFLPSLGKGGSVKPTGMVELKNPEWERSINYKLY